MDSDQGYATINSVWLNAMPHEIGHLLGFHHAGTDADNDGWPEYVYHDGTDIMGGPMTCKFFIIFEVMLRVEWTQCCPSRLCWLAVSSKQTDCNKVLYSLL
jgi:hypothetical protein